MGGFVSSARGNGEHTLRWGLAELVLSICSAGSSETFILKKIKRSFSGILPQGGVHQVLLRASKAPSHLALASG